MTEVATREWRALGTTVVLGTVEASDIDHAEHIAHEVLDDFDRTCSRFRADSELISVPCDGQLHPISPLLRDALAVALRAARITEGLVDPTVGASMVALGYDADFETVVTRRATNYSAPTPVVAGWNAIRLEAEKCMLSIAQGVVLDLGATAKAFAADTIAREASRAGVRGVLVNLGGDIATGGESPAEGWVIAIGDDHRVGGDHVVSIRSGGLATSSTTVRRWDENFHHILDPRTGLPADSPWRTVAVTASTCVDANIASTAAIVLGDQAPQWLRERGLPSRLVANDGDVLECGWLATSGVNA